MARTGSLPYVLLQAVITVPFFSFLWGQTDSNLFDTVTALNVWGQGGTSVQLVHQWIVLAWDGFLVVLFFGAGLQLFIAARLQTSSSNMFLRAFSLYLIHVVMLFWSVVIPRAMIEFIDLKNTPWINDALAQSEILFSINFLISIVFVYGPAIILIGMDAWYLFAPIRDDVWGGVRA